MTQGEYPYPPDEFDTVDPSDGPRGVHRRPRSPWATVWPYLVALVVAAVLAFVAVGLLWDDETAPSAGASGTATGTVEEPATTETPVDPGTASAVEPKPTATTQPPVDATTQAPVEPPVVEPPPAPDLSTQVVVLNSTSVSGLAAQVAQTLQDAGWTRVASANFTGSLDASTVRYGDPEVEVSARAVAEALGIGVVELAESGAVDGIQVVLEPDFTG